MAENMMRYETNQTNETKNITLTHLFIMGIKSLLNIYVWQKYVDL